MGCKTPIKLAGIKKRKTHLLDAIVYNFISEKSSGQLWCSQSPCQLNKFELFIWFLNSYLTLHQGQLPENWASDAMNCQKKRHTWAITCRISLWHSWPSETLRLLKWRISEMMSRTDLPISPFNILRRYFGHHTTWYLHCHTACANPLNCFTEYLLLMFRAANLHLGAVFLAWIISITGDFSY